MPELISGAGPALSEYNQLSFVGGMNLSGDDSRLQPNQYRIGFNITNRFDELDLIPSSIKDTSAPSGIKQGIVAFGNYLVLFSGGNAYYRYYNAVGWTIIASFSGLLSPIAIRYWTVAIPISITNYLRMSAASGITGNTQGSPTAAINVAAIAGASQGNLPGLLVQDNINQPVLIFLDINGYPVARVTQKYSQWSITFTDNTGNTVQVDGNGNPMDYREYVPIGNCMCWNNGVLFIVSQDGNTIYRSVSGRPLDFVVNVVNTLPLIGTTPPYTQKPGGDAGTTSTSVGVGGISCIRPLSSSSIFVSASGACFSLAQNMTPNAPTIFGEYTFIRTFLFNAFCLSDRAIIDTIGDTRFIELTGIRSFNAVQQLQNEGRNAPFSAMIQPIFMTSQTQSNSTITQDVNNSAAVLYDNYELYSVMTILGPAICKFDTINNCWVSLDIQQVSGQRIKQFVALQINVLALFGITENDEVYQLYASKTDEDTGLFRTVGVCANVLYANINIKMNNPKSEVKLVNSRVILNKITDDTTVTCIPFVNNRVSSLGAITKNIVFQEPTDPFADEYTLPDVDTQLTNLLFKTPNIEQGWKVFNVYSWTDGVITQYSMELKNFNPQQPLTTQGCTT